MRRFKRIDWTRAPTISRKYDAELTKYWLDRDGSRIHSSCRIHLPTWFADLGRKHEPDGL
jgi:hypothetical protein